MEHYSYIDSDGNVSGLSIPTVVERVYIGDGKLPDDFPQSSQKPLNSSPPQGEFKYNGIKKQ